MFRMFAVLLLTLVMPSAVRAQESAAQPGKLRTEGLHYAADLSAIYLGDFGEITFGRRGTPAAALIGAYVQAFSERCAASLPANKVEITVEKCEREEWQENAYGEVPGSRHCARTVTVRTGRYADPELYKLSGELQAEQVVSAIGDIGEALRDPIGYTSSKVKATLSANKDMPQLLAVNGCASPATKRFQANLIRFASRRDAIVSTEARGHVNESIVPMFTGWAASTALWCGNGCEGNSDPAKQMLRTPEQPQGPMVLQCEYISQGGARYLYFFWPGTPPPNIKELLAADKKGILRYMGAKALKKCPETKEKALALLRAAMVETGFPTD